MNAFKKQIEVKIKTNLEYIINKVTMIYFQQTQGD